MINVADVKRYAIQFAVFLFVLSAFSIYEAFRDSSARLDEPIVERHGTFVMQQYDTFGRTKVSLPYGKTKTFRLDPARPMAPQVKQRLGLWELNITTVTDLNALVSQRKLRRTTQKELDAWFAQKQAKQAYKSTGAKLTTSAQKPYYTLMEPIGGETYLKDRKARLLIPEQFSLADAPQGAVSYLRMNEGDCWGDKGQYCARRAATANDTCMTRLPREFDVHMIGAMKGAKDSPVRVGGAPTQQLDLYIANTPRPIVLAIGAMEPTTWAFHLEPGANIAGVLVSGNERQAISGLPKSIQSRFTHDDMVPNECGNGLASHLRSDLDAWSRDLRAIFGKNVAQHQAKRIAHNFEIGGNFNLPKAQNDTLFGEFDNKGVVPQIAINRDTLRYSVAPPSEEGIWAMIKDWISQLFDPKVLPFVIGAILAVRPIINVIQRYRGKRTYGTNLPPRSVKRAYLQGVGVTLAGFSVGMIAVDQHPMLQQGSMPLFLVVLLAVAAAPIVKRVYAFVRNTELEIGLACLLTGALVASGAAYLMAMLKGGDLSLLMAPLYGALGGLEFWRARRFPGATEKGTKIATLLSFVGGESVADTAATSQAGKPRETLQSQQSGKAPSRPKRSPAASGSAPRQVQRAQFGRRSGRPVR